MPDPATTLRPLTAADLPAAQALSAAVGWPHRVEDWDFVLRLGSGLAAEVGGEVAGVAMTWPFGVEAAAMGMIIVSPGLQGRGIGRTLTRAALDAIGDRHAVLFATAAGLPLYKSLGFRTTGATVRQQQGLVTADGGAVPGPGERLRPTVPGDLPILLRLDRAATGLDRERALIALLELAEGVVLERGGEACGVALLRRFGRGHVIGPVIAPDPDGAKVLISHLLGRRRGLFVRVDVPEEGGLPGWQDGIGLADAGPAIRMVRGAPPDRSGAARTFALLNQALG